MGHISFQYNFPFLNSVSELLCEIFMGAVAFTLYIGGIIGIIVYGSSSFFLRHFLRIKFEKPNFSEFYYYCEGDN